MSVRHKGTNTLGAARLQGVALYDSFTAPDNTALAGHVADTGQTWGAYGGSGIITGGAAVPLSGTSGPNGVDCGYASYILTARVTGIAPGLPYFPGIYTRIVDANNHLHLQMQSSTSYLLESRVSGSYVSIATINVSPTVGDILQIQMSGSTATVTINGVQQFSGSVSGISTTSTVVGIGSGTTSSDPGSFDDFTVRPG